MRAVLIPAAWLAPATPVVLAALIPVFWLPWRWPLLTLAALLAALAWWLRACWSTSRAGGRTGLDLPLALLMTSVCVSCVAVTSWNLALAKVLGVVLGVFMVVTVTRTVRTREQLLRAHQVLMAISGVVAAVGLIGTQWKVGQLVQLDALYRRLPGLVRGIAPQLPNEGINPNELAGVAVLLAPMLIAAGRMQARVWRWASLAGGGVLIALLVLSQSRSGLTGGLAAGLLMVAAMAAERGGRRHVSQWIAARRIGLAALVAMLCAIAGAVVALGGAPRWVASLGDVARARMELWQRAGWMVADFPFTGIGLGQFSAVLPAGYPIFSAPPGTFMPHAHNLILEYAVELGLPGAAAFVAVLVGFFRQMIGVVATTDAVTRWTAIGAAAAIAGYLAYGLTDAIAPGARGGIVFWLVIGLGLAAADVARRGGKKHGTASGIAGAPGGNLCYAPDPTNPTDVRSTSPSRN